nr:hypothetical protein [Tanacetum cinerariifolium]
MPPMTTRSAGGTTIAPRGGRTGVQTGRRGNHVNNQGNNGNRDGNVVNDNIRGDVRNVIVNNGRGGCSYKKFLACNLRDFDGKRGAIAYTRWTEKIESVHDMSGCRANQKVKLVPYLVNPEKNIIERDGKVKDDNKKSKTSRVFATTTSNLVKKEIGPRMVNPVNARNPTTTRGACFECGGTNRYKVTCLRGTHHDPNIMMGTSTLNNHYATTLFDSGAAYSFVSPTFIPLLDIEPSNLRFTYKIEITSGQLVEIRMDSLSEHRAKIVCHEKVVRIPLPHNETLRVLRERPEEKMRHLMRAKAKEHKLKDIAIMRRYSETKEEHEKHLGLILELLKKEKLYAKFSKCEF